jgi:hypothetical protein
MTVITRNAVRAIVTTAVLTLATLAGLSVVSGTGLTGGCATTSHSCLVRADGGTGNG